MPGTGLSRGPAGLRLAAAMLALAASALASAANLPDFATVKAAHVSSEARLLDRNGETLSEIRMEAGGPRRLDWVPLERFSPALRAALIASEDKRFYQHSGVDWQAFAGAVWDNLRRGIEGRRPRGASTISMQVAGMLDESLRLRGAMRTLEQKWDQALAARELERHWSKAQILEAYLNLATFRGELSGIGAAARGLFGTGPEALDGAQAAILTALLRGPNSPPAVVAQRACLVSARLPRADPCAAVTRLALSVLPASPRIEQPDYAPQIARRLLSRPAMALGTTLDAAIQRHAVAALERHLEPANGALEGALVVLDNASGDILAHVSSRQDVAAATDGDGVLVPRPSGAMVLPFLYGLVLEKRWLTAASVLDDGPAQGALTDDTTPPAEQTPEPQRPVSLRTALGASLAVPAQRSLSLIGLQALQERLHALGLDRLRATPDPSPGATLPGAPSLSLLNLSNAYRALANGGEWGPLRLRQDDPEATRRRVMRREASFIVADILADAVARHAIPDAEDPLPSRIWNARHCAAGDDQRDAWCIGFTTRYTVGVRIGAGVPDATQFGLPGDPATSLWRDMLRFLHADGTARPPRPPAGVTTRLTRFEPPVEPPRREWFVAGTELELVGTSGAGSPGLPAIDFPAPGDVIGLDPGVAPERQRLVFVARNAVPGLRWRVDGVRLEAEGAQAPWRPTPGRHRLALLDLHGVEVDAVDFEVRGAAALSQPAQQQGGEQ